MDHVVRLAQYIAEIERLLSYFFMVSLFLATSSFICHHTSFLKRNSRGTIHMVVPLSCSN